jgi:prepilin-type N-terminal cleavage/methylation domain-containing protein
MSSIKLWEGMCVRRQGFTLAELLVVIAIVSMVLLFTLPAFQGIGRGSAMTTAHAQLKATISLARQWAITHRQRTYVVFPPLITGMGSDTPKAYRAFAVIAANTPDPGYTYVKEWTYLPEGVRFDNLSRPTKNLFRADCQVSLPFPLATSPVQDLPAIVFKPDGVTGAPDGGYELFFREGWATVNTNTWAMQTDFRANTTTQSIEVLSLTGGLKFHDYSLE